MSTQPFNQERERETECWSREVEGDGEEASQRGYKSYKQREEEIIYQ